MSYKSPIETVMGQLRIQLENNVCEAVRKYGINVDKEELEKALRYDRHQYEKGYSDGYDDGFGAVKIVYCKDCKYWQDNNGGYPHEECRWGKGETPDADDFCSYGERKVIFN